MFVYFLEYVEVFWLFFLEESNKSYFEGNYVFEGIINL